MFPVVIYFERAGVALWREGLFRNVGASYFQWMKAKGFFTYLLRLTANLIAILSFCLNLVSVSGKGAFTCGCDLSLVEVSGGLQGIAVPVACKKRCSYNGRE